MAVSYTHLDVYKRQALPFVGAALFVILLVVAVRMRRSDTGKDLSLIHI